MTDPLAVRLREEAAKYERLARLMRGIANTLEDDAHEKRSETIPHREITA